jgi:hypothetical protein
MPWRIGGAIRTGARYAREKQVLRCAQNDNQKSKSNDNDKGKSNGNGNSNGSSGLRRGLCRA